MRKLLALDLSTSCTGWALLEQEASKLLSYGALKPRVKNPTKGGIPRFAYPRIQALKMRDLIEQIQTLIAEFNPDVIAIEEVVSHKSRLTGKVLDGLHFLLIDRIFEFKGEIRYVDVSGTHGWRPQFKIRQSEQDKLINKDRKKLNKKLKGKDKLPIIDWKTLSSRFVNKRFGLTLDPSKEASHGDMADAIMVGLYCCEVN